jgi:hypothetical protein
MVAIARNGLVLCQPCPRSIIPTERPSSRRDTVAATLLHGIGAILWEADARTFAFKFVSREAEQVLGYPVEQWLNEPDFWRTHTHQDDVGLVLRLLRRCLGVRDAITPSSIA